jgi:hypothetical protein
MAAWQVDFYIIPRRALMARAKLDSSDLAATAWWATDTLPPDYQRRLGAVASVGPSSSADVQTWGSDDGNRIDVLSEQGRVRAITTRVDVRRLDSKFGAALLQFVRAAGAVLVRSDGLVVEPTIAAYAGSLRGSGAWKLSNDPAAKLSKYSDTNDDDL